jgi:uncharacterized membrane protein
VTAVAVIVCVVCQLFLVIGQILLKHGMKPEAEARPAWRRLGPGVACLTAWFFLWLGLLQQWELSHIFPFEGLNPALLVIGAAVFLRERVGAVTWVGIGLVCAGTILVGAS